MLNREDHYLLGVLVDHIINKLAVSGCYELADAFDILAATNLRKKRQILKRAQYCISDNERRGRIMGMQILGDR